MKSLRHLAPPLLVVLAGFGLRMYRLDYQPLWWDEGYSVFFATQPLADLLRATAQDIHPPFYYGLLHIWTALLSPAPSVIRFLTAGTSLLCLPALYTLGRRLGSRRPALLSAAILALSPFQIHHAQEARMYALVTLLGLLSTYLLARALDRQNPQSLVSNLQSPISNPQPPTPNPQFATRNPSFVIRRSSFVVHHSRSTAILWTWYTVLTALALATHYYAVFIPLFQGLYVILCRRDGLRRWVVATAGAAILYLPWLVMIAGELPQRSLGKAAAAGHSARSLLSFFSRYLNTIAFGYGTSPPGLSGFISGVIVLLIVLGVLVWGRRSTWIVLYLLVPLAGGYGLNRLLPFEGFPRLLAYAAPAAYLLAAAGLAALWQQPITGSAVTAVALAALGMPYPQLYAAPRQPGEDYRPLMAQVSELATPNDVVVLDFPWQAGYFQSYRPAPLALWVAPGALWAANPSRMERDLNELIRTYDRLWYVAEAGLGAAPGQNIEGYLTAQAYQALNVWHGQNRLLLYGTGPAGRRHRMDVTFGSPIRLLEVSLPASTAPNAVLPLTLRWQATQRIDKRYKVFVHILDGAGQLVAQHDTEPVAGLRPMTSWAVSETVIDRLGVLIPAGTPPGTYAVELGLYDFDSGERLPVTREGRPMGDRLLLNAVTISRPTD